MIIRALAILAATLSLVLPGNGAAAAQTPRIDIGPGSSFYTEQGPFGGGSWCTVAAVGRDNGGRLVALTASHCMTRTNDQAAHQSGSNAPIGHFATWSSDWPVTSTFPAKSRIDYAVILLDESIVHGVNQIPGGVRIDHIGPEPIVGRVMCKYGQVSHTTCGPVTGYRDNLINGWAAVIPGDSGGAAYLGTGIMGVNSAINPLAILTGPFQFAGIRGILADIAAHGPNAVGTGFTPLH